MMAEVLYNIFLGLHIVVTIGLIGTILVQRGRSSGIIEALGGVESIFGTKTSSFFVRGTVILAVCFFGTTIGLAYFSKEKGRSLLETYKEQPAEKKPAADAAKPGEAKPQTAPAASVPDAAPQPAAAQPAAVTPPAQAAQDNAAPAAPANDKPQQ